MSNHVCHSLLNFTLLGSGSLLSVDNLWPSKAPGFPRIIEVEVFFPDCLGASGINGIATVYQTFPGAPPETISHGKLTGNNGIVRLGSSLRSPYIVNVTALVDEEETSLFALTFGLSDGSEHGPFSGHPYPPFGKNISASGRAVGFYRSIDEGMAALRLLQNNILMAADRLAY
ncbi:hypothetical protein DXG01_002751 [Tephrocybe rancida]|nr:hypothetical protein DXG01_002751 [Tephrocybe rancida]